MSAASPPSRSGCLTAAEVAQVRAAPAGEVPEGLARHLASCPRCQERALFGGVRPARKPRGAPLLPTPTRAFLLLGIMLAVIIAFFFTLQRLVGGL